jgi:tripartite-type tricarboxylate transporter receptor subunit TctC
MSDNLPHLGQIRNLAPDRRGTILKLRRRQFLRIAAGAAALSTASRMAKAETYPSRPVRIMVGLPAGYATDIIARLTGQWLSDRLGQQFVVENRPGASGNIAVEAVVKALPDGYTLLQINSGNAINTTLYPNLNFNFIRDIAPVASTCKTPFVMVVNPSIPVKTVPEFIAYAKANPGKINMASPGVGSTNHIFGALFATMTSIEIVHVPYRGSFMPDLLAGQIQMVFSTIPLVIEQVRTDKLRALAVTTTSRLEVLPGIPAMVEFVPGYNASGWQGIGAPKNTPTEIVDKLNREISSGLADPMIKQRLLEQGSLPIAMSPADFSNLIADETERWAKVIRAANIKAE